MIRLTREVRFAVGLDADDPSPGKTGNGHAGHPPLQGLGMFLTLQVTLEGNVDPTTGYLKNIKEIDTAVRAQAIDIVGSFVRHSRAAATGPLAQRLFEQLHATWPNLVHLRLALSPFTTLAVRATEYPMVRFSQKFEFSAAHRLHSDAMDTPANAATFGKCNNPHGHGHNYEVQVTLRGKPGPSGQLMPIEKLEEIVIASAIEKIDHKFLNIEVEEFKTLNPTVENIAMVIYQWLKPKIAAAGSELAAITVWETPKTWSEYFE